MFIKKHCKFLFLPLLLSITLLTSCAFISDDGNLNSTYPRAAFLDGIVYIDPDGSVSRLTADSTCETLYSPTGELLGLTADGEHIYLLERERSGAPELSRAVSIIRLGADGEVANLTAELFADCEPLHNTLGFIRKIGDKLFISGAGAYGDAYILDLATGEASSANMPAANAFIGSNVYFTDGGYEIYSLSLEDISAEPSVYYDGGDFAGYADAEFYPGTGIEQLTAGESLYFSLRDADGYSIYAYDGALERLHTQELQVRELLYYGGELYFSDAAGIYRLGDGEVERICEVVSREDDTGLMQAFNADFAIHDGRLYYDLGELSNYIELK